MNIKTASDLKYFYEQKQPNGHYFDRKAMKFFGDKMSNYGVRDLGTYWELYRKKPVAHGIQNSKYFNKETMAIETLSPESIIPQREQI